jgi:hypothetical protein
VNDLHKALGDIGSIRRQVARSTQFRGYGPATLLATCLFAISAAGAQALWVPDPDHHVNGYLIIWVTTAILSAALTGTQMYTRSRRIHSGISNEMMQMAVEQFLPSVGAGLLLTFVLLRSVPGAVWMLPGLWQVIFSLGIFSSCRFLPRLVVAAGVAGSSALSPWAMGIPFGMGQLFVAGVLLFAAREACDAA